jgi:hypothetical protein
VQWYDQRVHKAYESIVEQMEAVHARFSVADLQTVLRYLGEIKNVR